MELGTVKVYVSLAAVMCEHSVTLLDIAFIKSLHFVIELPGPDYCINKTLDKKDLHVSERCYSTPKIRHKMLWLHKV